MDKDGVLIVRMDKSTWTGPLLIRETAHGQVHVDWTTSGLKVD